MGLAGDLRRVPGVERRLVEAARLGFQLAIIPSGSRDVTQKVPALGRMRVVEVPTLAETVMPGFEAGAWQGLMVPAGTPAAVVQRLNAEVNKALQSADMRDKLAVQGAEPLGSTPEEYGAYVRKELARWATVVKATGVTLE